MMMNKRKYWFLPFVGIGFIALASLAVMQLWNHILPDVISSVKQITYWQALGLLVLSRLLFGNFGGRGGGMRRRRHHPYGRHWRHKWANMSEEERKQMKEEWKKKCGWDE